MDKCFQVEWDEEKNKNNLKKHGIGFEEAMFVFLDPMCVEIFDAEHSIDEERYITIGMVRHIVVVVYTERKSIVRLISARNANKSERIVYYGYR